jgi:hypothetical protein
VQFNPGDDRLSHAVARALPRALEELALAGVEDRVPNNILALVTDNHVVVGEFAVRGMAGFLVVDVERIGPGVIRHPHQAFSRFFEFRQELQVILNFGYGQSCFLFSREVIRRVRKAVITKPSWSNSL